MLSGNTKGGVGQPWRMAARALWRERHLGSLRLLVAATVLAVAALSSVGFFADRVRQALNAQSHLLLGADLRLVSQQPWDDSTRKTIFDAGAELAETVMFPSMAGHGEAFQLVDVKAVSDGYPLRGRLRISDDIGQADRAATGIPPPGTVWIDERLVAALAAGPGDLVQLGGAQLQIGAILTLEPDRGINFFSLSPRLMLNLADLPQTGLLQNGSRVRYRLLVAGDAPAIERIEAALTPRLGRGQQIENAANARPEIRNALDRAERFLGLAAILTVVLSTVAIALAVRRYMQAAYDGLAVMRCLGATQSVIQGLVLRQFLLLAGSASLLGIALGFAAHWVLSTFLATLLAVALPLPGWQPAGHGLAVGVLLVMSLILPRLLQLKHLPSLRVIRREIGPPPQSAWVAYGVAGLLVFGLMTLIAGDLRLSVRVFGGFIAAGAFFVGFAYVAVRALVHWRRVANPSGWVGEIIAAVGRRPLAVAVQVGGLGLGLMALLLLTVTQRELISAWERAAPADAHNRFIINVQPDQVEAVRETLRGAGVDSPLEPMVRARLVRIGERSIAPDDFADERARRLTEREFNLSWRSDLPAGNVVAGGRWFAADEGPGAASVEAGLAETLGIKLGDELQFDLAGTPVSAKVVGLRQLKWESMRVNFFVIFSPATLEGFPASYIASFHAASGQGDVASRLLQRFPNLTVIDVSAMLEQLRGITDQVIAAVQFLFVFSLFAGITVLYGTFAVAFDERRHEIAVMRALGATRARLARTLRLEFAAIGALAGFLAAVGATLIGWVLARQVFEIMLEPSYWLVPSATVGGALAIVLVGRYALQALLSAPPMQSLRNAE